MLVVKSNGKNFCTGYDLTEWAYLWGTAETPSRPEDARPHRRAPIFSRREFHESRERWMRLWRIRQATIGVVRGACVAGGLDLAGVLDIVFTAEDARFGQPEARTMGEIHMFGMWPVHLGMRKTKEWLFTGDEMTGVEAAELGLANRAVPADEVEAVAYAYAERVANVPLEMIYAHKESTNRWWDAMGITSPALRCRTSSASSARPGCAPRSRTGTPRSRSTAPTGRPTRRGRGNEPRGRTGRPALTHSPVQRGGRRSAKARAPSWASALALMATSSSS